MECCHHPGFQTDGRFRKTEHPRFTAPARRSGGAPKSEYPCPDCGELVREGLVRCWNCGSFLKAEMEASYRKMRANPAPVIFSPIAEEEKASLDDFLSSAHEQGNEGGDFELSGPGMTKSPGSATARQAKQPDASPTSEATDSQPSTASPEGSTSPDAESQVPHSIATGGDALLQVALQQEAESLRRQIERGAGVDGVMKISDGFLIDAPKGCRIQVRDERTGELRRLTFAGSSKVRISLLDKLEALAKSKAAKGKEAEVTSPHLSAGKFAALDAEWSCPHPRSAKAEAQGRQYGQKTSSRWILRSLPMGC